MQPDLPTAVINSPLKNEVSPILQYDIRTHYLNYWNCAW